MKQNRYPLFIPEMEMPDKTPKEDFADKLPNEPNKENIGEKKYSLSTAKDRLRIRLLASIEKILVDRKIVSRGIMVDISEHVKNNLLIFSNEYSEDKGQQTKASKCGRLFQKLIHDEVVKNMEEWDKANAGKSKQAELDLAKIVFCNEGAIDNKKKRIK